MNFDHRWHREHQRDQRARRAWRGTHTGRRRRGFGRAELIATALAGIFGGLGWAALPLVLGETGSATEAPRDPRAQSRGSTALHAAPPRPARFALCHSGGGANCVVDGDTFWMAGTKIRIADIDAPETHPARCAREAELGAAATRRLHALLNSGPVTLEAIGRDSDRYGRQLRVVSIDGRGVGDTLVAESLARRYAGGYREGWCG